MLPINVSVNPPQPICLEADALDHVRYFKRHWRDYAVLTGIDKLSDEVKIAVLHLSIGRAASTVIENLLTLTEEEKKNSEVVLSALEKHYLPRGLPNQRFIFNTMVQEPNETVEEFSCRVREQAKKCDFKSELLNFIRDRFLVGLYDVKLKNLLAQRSDLTFDEAYECARANEVGQNTIHSNVDNGSSMNLQNGCSKIRYNEIEISDDEPLVPMIKLEKIDAEPSSSAAISPRSSTRTAIPQAPFTSNLRIPPNNTVVPEEEVVPIHSSVSVQNNYSYQTPALTNSTEGEMQPEFETGSYVILKTDKANLSQEVPIWRIDSTSLLQKFTPVIKQGERFFKSNAVYCGWKSTQHLYEKVNVKIHNKVANQKEVSVQLKEDIGKKFARKRKAQKHS